MVKKKKKPCDERSSACYWQFADLCLYFPSVKDGRPEFRRRAEVTMKECEAVHIPTEYGSRYNPLHFVAARSKKRSGPK